MQPFTKQDALNVVFEQRSLSLEQSYSVFSDVLAGKLTEVETTALLIALKMKSESISEIAGAAKAMTDSAKTFPSPDYEFSDIVGTGGDGHHTINISSAAAIVAASCGIKVAKHGNRSVSSKSGSSDLFAAFGLKLDMTPDVARACLDASNLCFLAAPNYHLGMKYVMPIRTSLKTRTVFNVLGPLANPSKPTHHLLGVYTPDLLDVYAEILVNLGRDDAYIVHGSGLDELAIHNSSQVVEVRNGNLTKHEWTPEDFGLKRYSLDDIKGGEPQDNKKAIEAVLAGKGREAHTAAIAMNAAALMHLNRTADSLEKCTDIAMQSIALGKPLDTIRKAAELSQQD